MTKMKSKKMTKSTFAVIIMAVAMVAMLAFGGTYAYFTSTAKTESDTFTTAVVQLKNTSETALAVNSEVNIVPGAYIFGSATESAEIKLDATGTTADVYVFVRVKTTIGANDITIDGTSDSVLKFELDSTVANQAGVKNGWQLVPGKTDAYYMAISYDKIAELQNFKFTPKMLIDTLRAIAT